MSTILRRSRALVSVVGLTALLAVACSGASSNQASPTALSPVDGSTAVEDGLAAQGNGSNTALVCHVRDGGAFAVLAVNPNAVAAHLGHGDGQPGGAVPGMAGYVFNDSCVPHPQADLLACPCWNTFSQSSLAAHVNGLQVQACSWTPFAAAILTTTDTLTINLMNPNGAFCGGPGTVALVNGAEGLACLNELKALIPLVPACQQ
jgi:hypothetical protein